MITTLMWKDWRLNRVPVIGSLLFLTMPTVVCTLISWNEKHELLLNGPDSGLNLRVAVIVGAVCTLLVAPLLGGIAFARERRERSGEFLWGFALERWKIVLSKLVVALAVMMAPWVVALPIAVALNGARGASLAPTGEGPLVITAIVGSGLMLFGVGWLLSTFTRSEVIAAGCSVFVYVACFIAAFSIHLSVERTGRLDPHVWEKLWIFCIVMGLITTVAGTIVALVRRSP